MRGFGVILNGMGTKLTDINQVSFCRFGIILNSMGTKLLFEAVLNFIWFGVILNSRIKTISKNNNKNKKTKINQIKY